jgi:hypothetical protein
MRVLLITLAIGSEYYAFYRSTFMKSQENYAKKHGYDFHVVTHFPEAEFMTENYPKNRSTITMHKILVCSQEWSDSYDMIIFIDADILIHPDSPPLHSYMDYGEKIGIVDEFSQPTPEKRIALQAKKWMGNFCDRISCSLWTSLRNSACVEYWSSRFSTQVP